MPLEIVGHAIVSADGMIATRDHRTPPELRSEADWLHFQAALDQARLVVMGRIGHEDRPNAGRLRLVPTTRVARLDVDPADPRAILWNPAAVPADAVIAELGITEGIVAVTGGTRVFDLFLPLLTAFELARVASVTVPDGLPCFSAGDPRQVLTAEGLRAVQTIALDAIATLTIWRR